MKPVASIYTRRRSRFGEMQRQSEIMLVIVQLLASVDDKIEGICSVLAVPVDDGPGGDVVRLKPKPGPAGVA